MTLLKITRPTCLVIIECLNDSADPIEIGSCVNYTDSMVWNLSNKLPEVDIFFNNCEIIENYEYAVITNQGSFIEHYNLCQIVDRMVEEDLALVGHILQEGEYYTVHDQCFVLNVDKWKKAGRPSLRNSVAKKATAVVRSGDNLHHNYTPTWIKTDVHPLTKEFYQVPVDSFNAGSQLISDLLKHQFNISAFNRFERKHKYYLYPGTKWFYQALFQDENYGFWNEPIERIYDEMLTSYEQYYGVASPYFILLAAKKNPKCKSWIVVDNNDVQLLYCKYVLENIKTKDPWVIFENFFEEYPWINRDNFEDIDTSHTITKNIKFIRENLVNADLGHIRYIKQNLWTNTEFNIQNKTTVVYVSNVFLYQPASKWMSMQNQLKAQNKFLSNVRSNKHVQTIIYNNKVCNISHD